MLDYNGNFEGVAEISLNEIEHLFSYRDAVWRALLKVSPSDSSIPWRFTLEGNKNVTIGETSGSGELFIKWLVIFIR